jgi:3-oxoacyl-[acyl-carrier protein] reductase
MSSTEPGLSGRVAVVTGSVKNIGRAIALALAADGAAVVVNSRSRSAEGEALCDSISKGGGRALFVAADITREEDVERLIGAAVDRFGRVDILVNNAAIRPLAPIEEMTLAQWREVMAVILDGAFLCARACVPHMRSGGGRIINIGGLSAHRGAGQRAHVVAAKAGLLGLTKALAIELAGEGITVNCVVPGPIATVRDASAGAVPPHPSGFATPVGRMGKPEEIAAMVRLLASDASAFTTGQTIHVNGGLYFP